MGTKLKLAAEARTRSMLLNLNKLVTTRSWLVALALILLCNNINKINCDPQQPATNEVSTDQPGASGPADQANATTVLNATTHADTEYKQRPNPLGSSTDDSTSTKINYDMQHEQQQQQQQQPSTTTTSGPLTSTTGAVTTSVPVNTSSASQDLAQPVIEKKSLIDDETPMSGYQTGGVGLTGDVVVGDESSPQAQDYLASASTSGMQESAAAVVPALATAAPLDDAILDLDSAAATNPSIISRHGRASVSQQVAAYSPPASSRLSAYTPALLLQNSRSHPPATSGTQQQQVASTTTLAPKPPKPQPTHPFDPIIVCYLGSWSVYRPSLAKFTPENINPFLCTHIIYAFAGLSSKYELKPFDSYNDITQGGYRKFTSLKEHNKQLKTLIAVGGWNEGSAR